MGDAGWAGGDGEKAREFRPVFLLRFLQLFAFGFVDDFEEGLFALRGEEVVLKVFVHQEIGEAREDVEVDVVLGVGRGDQKEQLDGFAIQGGVIDAVFDDHGRQGGF